MSSIQEYIKSWYQLDKLISQKSKDLQVLKEKKSNLDTQISKYLLQNKLTNNAYKIENQKIQFTEKKTKESFSQSYIKRNLIQYFQSEEKANVLYNYLLNNRNTNVSYGLSKTVIKPDE